MTRKPRSKRSMLSEIRGLKGEIARLNEEARRREEQVRCVIADYDRARRQVQCERKALNDKALELQLRFDRKVEKEVALRESPTFKAMTAEVALLKEALIKLRRSK